MLPCSRHEPFNAIYVLYNTENDYSSIANEFVFSQQEDSTQCVVVELFTDSDSNEGREQFTVALSLSLPSDNVILRPSSATVSISDSLTSILSDLATIAASGEQTEDNLRLIADVLEDITSSQVNGQTETSTEVTIQFYVNV